MKVCIIFSLLICTPRNDFEGGRKVILQPGKKVGLYYKPTSFSGSPKIRVCWTTFLPPSKSLLSVQIKDFAYIDCFFIGSFSCFPDLNFSRIHSHLFLKAKRKAFVSRKNIIEYFQNTPVGNADCNRILQILWRIPIKVPIRIPEKRKWFTVETTAKKENLRASHNGGKLTFLWKKSCNKNLPGLSLGFDLFFSFFPVLLQGHPWQSVVK